MMKTVWIDAGHGGKDPGASGNGLQEKDITLTISLMTKQRLEADYEAVQVLMSRSTDVFVELADRTKAANQAGADILVSIHCNSGGGAGGFESFRYTSALAATVALQNALHTEIISALTSFGVRDRGKKTGNLHMLRESRMPAVLTENLFVDVVSDAALLKRSDVITAIADAHASGIAKYLGLKRKAAPTPGSTTQRDIHVVSPWAAAAWSEAVADGYFDGRRPGAPMTREEAAILVQRLRKEWATLLQDSKNS